MTPPKDFQTLIDTYGDTVYRMALQITGGRESEARDLVQDAFVKVWRRWDQDRPYAFKEWMYRLMHNLHVDGLRKRGRAVTLSLDAPMPDSDERWDQHLAGKGDEPDRLAHQQDLCHRVRQALGQLDVVFRRPVMLADMDGWSYDEIAVALNCPVGTVRSRIHRGRLQLRRLLLIGAAAIATVFSLYRWALPEPPLPEVPVAHIPAKPAAPAHPKIVLHHPPEPSACEETRGC